MAYMRFQLSARYVLGARFFPVFTSPSIENPKWKWGWVEIACYPFFPPFSSHRFIEILSIQLKITCGAEESEREGERGERETWSPSLSALRFFSSLHSSPQIKPPLLLIVNTLWDSQNQNEPARGMARGNFANFKFELRRGDHWRIHWSNSSIEVIERERKSGQAIRMIQSLIRNTFVICYQYSE